MKFSVSIYSFHKYAKMGPNAIFSAIDYAALLGFDGIDFIDAGLEYDEYLPYAKRVGEYCREKGLEPACFCSAADFLNGSGGDLDAEIARVCRQVDKAAAYGVPVMRHDVVGFMNNFRGVGSYEKLIPRLAKGCLAVTRYAEEKGIRTCTENHGYLSQDSARVEALIEAVGHPNFGMLVDRKLIVPFFFHQSDNFAWQIFTLLCFFQNSICFFYAFCKRRVALNELNNLVCLSFSFRIYGNKEYTIRIA